MPEGPAGVAEVDVVERRAADGDRRDADAGALERREHRRHGGRAAVDAGSERTAVDERLADARARAVRTEMARSSPSPSTSSTTIASPRSSAFSSSGEPVATTRPWSTIASRLAS